MRQRDIATGYRQRWPGQRAAGQLLRQNHIRMPPRGTFEDGNSQEAPQKPVTISNVWWARLQGSVRAGPLFAGPRSCFILGRYAALGYSGFPYIRSTQHLLHRLQGCGAAFSGFSTEYLCMCILLCTSDNCEFETPGRLLRIRLFLAPECGGQVDVL